ncbi:MAG: immunoglobulin domain-containing protein [Verrucomicrobiales bacterium]
MTYPSIDESGNVYIFSGTRIYCFDSAGNQKWTRTDTPIDPLFGLLLWANHAPDGRTFLYGIGESWDLLVLDQEGFQLTEIVGGASATFDAEGHSYFRSDGLYRKARQDGAFVWSQATGGGGGSDGSNLFNILYNPTQQRLLEFQRFRKSNGILLDTRTEPDGFLSRTVIVDEQRRFIYMTQNGSLVCRNQAWGEIWRVTGIALQPPVTCEDGTTYAVSAVSTSPRILALDTQGELLWHSTPMEDPNAPAYDQDYPRNYILNTQELATLAVSPSGDVYAGARDGKLYACPGAAPLSHSPWPKELGSYGNANAEHRFSPELTSEPTNKRLGAGDLLQLSAGASARPVPSVQWFLNGEAIEGETGTSLRRSSVSLGDAGEYQAVFSNSEGQVETSPISVEVGFRLAAVPYPGGSVTVTPPLPADGIYDPETPITLVATPEPGFIFRTWLGDISGDSQEVTFLMGSNVSTSAYFEPIYTLDLQAIGSGSVSVSEVKDYYFSDEVVQFMATPEPGSGLLHWVVNGEVIPSYDGEALVYSISSDTEVTAVFAPLIPLSLNIEGGGSVEVVPDRATYPEGFEVELRASSDSGWAFKEWLGGPLGGATTAFSVTADPVTAVFVEGMRLLIGHNAGGSVSAEPDLEWHVPGSQVMLTATPQSEGYGFISWSGSASGSANPLTITMDTDKTVNATFSVLYNLEYLGQSLRGTVTSNVEQGLLPAGTLVTLTPVPNGGFEFTHWGGDFEGSENPLHFTLSGPSLAQANFRDIEPPVFTREDDFPIIVEDPDVDFRVRITDNLGIMEASWALDGVDQGAPENMLGGWRRFDIDFQVPGPHWIRLRAVDFDGNETVEDFEVRWEPEFQLYVPAAKEVREGQRIGIPLGLSNAGEIGDLSPRFGTQRPTYPISKPHSVARRLSA